MLLATSPHLATFARFGSVDYLADGDDVFYLAVARIPYYGENALRDPFAGKWEHVPCLDAWGLFVPLAKLTAFLGLSSIRMNLVWRVFGGTMLGFSVYFLFRRLYSHSNNPWSWALASTLLCLADSGFVQGRLLIQDFTFLKYILNGTTPLLKADALGQYRVVTPLLNLPFLFLLAGVLSPSARKNRRLILLGVVCLGLSLLLYFYFWTAAVFTLSVYLVLQLLRAWRQPQKRAVKLAEAKITAMVLAGGILVGIPQVYSNYRTFSSPAAKPILARLNKGYYFPPGSPVRRMYLGNTWALAKLGLGAAAILLLGLHELEVLWWFTFAGYALANSALLTGLEFENFHWSYVHAPFGEILVIAAVCFVLDRTSFAWTARKLFWVLPISLLTVAFVWRPYEALRAPEAAWNSRVLQDLRELQPALAKLDSNCVLVGPREAKIALLFTQCGQLYFDPYTNQSFISDEEVNQRHALNGWLQGLNSQQYDSSAGTGSFAGGINSEPQWQSARVRETRVKIFNELLKDSKPQLLERFRPNILLIPATSPVPDRAGPWLLIQKTSQWSLWKRLGS
jgi:hypothetical protein